MNGNQRECSNIELYFLTTFPLTLYGTNIFWEQVLDDVTVTTIRASIKDTNSLDILKNN